MQKIPKFLKKKKKNKDFPGGTVDRKLPANAGDPAL